ncbi:3D-(3,5/4)-trihydroxycyclohexane-1,2-dione acylhydrolase (decyclizing) [Celerinatantimonas sp. MCCC 1A17872]|uniref:3D-(3,5/4)-trihydroxycyclohexane-1,2-dione acylhydrolase (decyclizing) n=1 Tax=Celerinatantimonas sp. MCCC 1A17872 TaxID=3177514 RepID=UPI0038C17D53
MNTVRLTVAQALVRFLDNQYLEVDGQEIKFVKGIFGIFGHGNVVGLGQALEENSGSLEIHQGRNEQGMTHAAVGFAKQSLRQQIFACTSSIGPGAANMITAAATATANCIPVLLLPGDTYATRQPDPVLQQIEQSNNLSISTNDAFKAVSRYWDRITRPEQLMSACISAMRVLTDPAQTGAVTLALPQDVQGEAYDYPDYFFQRRVYRLERQEPTQAMLAQAVELIKSKSNPMIICGGGLKYSQAAESLKQFAKAFQIPFAETQAGKGTVESSYELNVGGIGETGCLAANILAKKADLIIGVGTRYTDFTTSSKWLFQNPDVSFLNININRFDAFKLDGVQMVADAKATLDALYPLVKAQNYHAQWGDEIADVRRKYEDERKRLYQIEFNEKDFVPEIDDHLPREKVYAEFKALTDSVLTQTRALGIVNRLLPENGIIVGASGSLPGDLQRIWNAPTAGSYHVEYGYSCMGYEVNASLGVKMAQPDHEVFTMVGDGSFMMLHSELVSSIQEHLKINVIVFDNMANGCINNLEMEHGMDSFYTEFRFRGERKDRLDGGLVPVDYAKVAEGYGCKTYRVATAEQLEAAIKDALTQDRSTLIDVKVLPKTMVHKYFSWWRVGVAQVSEKESIQKTAEWVNEKLSQARQY